MIFKKCTFYLNPHNKLDYPGPHFKECKFFNKNGVIVSNNYSIFYPKKSLIIKANTITKYPAWSKYINDGGEFESVCPNTFSIKTSSQLKPHKNIMYGSKNLSEISYLTGVNSAWVEGVDGDGIGENIFFEVNSLIADYESWGISSEFRIINGYAKP